MLFILISSKTFQLEASTPIYLSPSGTYFCDTRIAIFSPRVTCRCINFVFSMIMRTLEFSSEKTWWCVFLCFKFVSKICFLACLLTYYYINFSLFLICDLRVFVVVCCDFGCYDVFCFQSLIAFLSIGYKVNIVHILILCIPVGRISQLRVAFFY